MCGCKTQDSPITEPPAKRKQNASQESATSRTSRKAAKECSPQRKLWVKSKKQSSSEGAKERTPSGSARGRSDLKQVQAAIAGAQRGNWRDLRTVFEFAGISAPSKEAPR